MVELIDAYFRAYDDYQPLKRGEPHCRLDASELARLEPGLVGPLVGGVTFDEWGVDGARLCVLNALDAIEHGARVHVHTTVESVARRAPEGARAARATSSSARHRLTGETHAGRARASSSTRRARGAPSPPALGGLPQARVRVRPGKGIHVVLDRRLTNYAILSEAIDGRQIFLEPWQNVSVLGTTDDDYYGDLDDVRATSEEVRYLVQGVARSSRACAPRAPSAPTPACGRRSTPTARPRTRSRASTRSSITRPTARPGVYSMIGGKLASYRLFAQELSDLVAPRRLRRRRPVHDAHAPAARRRPRCPTRIGDSLARAARRHAGRRAAPRLPPRRARAAHPRARRRAGRASATSSARASRSSRPRCGTSSREEMARTVDDVARRTRLGLGACGGMRCAARCGQIVAEELDARRRPRAARWRAAFLVRQARTRVVALGPEQARQEALTLAHLRASLGEPE